MADKVSSVDTSEVTRNLQRAAELVPGLEDELLLVLAYRIVEEAKRITPVDTGALRASLGAKLVSPGVVMIFATMEYAAAVHENLEAYHEVGQAKYLEVPLNALTGETIQALARDLWAKLGAQL